MVQMNLFTQWKRSHRGRKHTNGDQEGGSRGGINWKTAADTYTSLSIKYTTNADPPYGVGDTTQYSVITRVGKGSKRADVYSCITDSFCCAAKTQHCQSTPLKVLKTF